MRCKAVFNISIMLLLILKVHGQLEIVTDDTPLTERGACISNPCLHDGMCTVTKSGFICTCVNGYIGVNCERRADDCPRDYSMKCIHGICKLNMNGSPQCICNDGFEGPQCSKQMENCASSPCQNGGQCVEKSGGYECKCLIGMKGTHCQIKSYNINKCLSTCGQHYFDGKCWHHGNSPIVVGWGLGEFICNTRQTCFNATKGDFDDHEYIVVQLKPVQMQDTDKLVFITDKDASMYDYHFVPHILPMEANSEQAFLTCNTSNAIPLTKNSTISMFHVNESLLTLGTQYFIADMNSLYRCNFGLRLNVTVKSQSCVDSSDSEIGRFCNGNGKCYTDFNRQSYECLCCEGYTGRYCQYEDPCFAQPCANGGKCNILDYGPGVLKHQCVCPSGYHGKLCTKLLDYCQSLPCENGASCYSEVNGYRCECMNGFSGQNCEINNDECASSPCRNGGICNDGYNNFQCDCLPGFKGTLCEVEINECEGQPCINGTCIDLINNYTCSCSSGHTGRNCDVLLNECESQPCVNGICFKENNDGFSCSCGIGYTGFLCELKLDLCLHSQYCISKHAQSCVHSGDNVTCVCADGWSGSNCGVNTDECIDNKCENGAKCVDKVNGYECKCKKGYTGQLCEVGANGIEPDIEINFMADNCGKFQNAEGVRHLEENILSLLRSACRCPLKRESLERKSSKVICKDNMAGIFQTNLAIDGGYEYKESIICGMKKKIQFENTPNLYHNTYIVGIKDSGNHCQNNDHKTVHTQATDSSSTAGIVIGSMITCILLIGAIIFIVMKIRKTRHFKVGNLHSFFNNNHHNAAYDGIDASKDSMNETSFNSTREDTTVEHNLDQPVAAPRWAESYERARKLYERNRSNISVVGRTHDMHSPDGRSSRI